MGHWEKSHTFSEHQLLDLQETNKKKPRMIQSLRGNIQHLEILLVIITERKLKRLLASNGKNPGKLRNRKIALKKVFYGPKEHLHQQ